MTITLTTTVHLVLPHRIQRTALLKKGHRVEFNATPGTITIIAKPAAAEDEYTPEQRRMIDARLAEAEKGPFYGPFDTADEAIAFLHKEIRASKGKRRKTSDS